MKGGGGIGEGKGMKEKGRGKRRGGENGGKTPTAFWTNRTLVGSRKIERLTRFNNRQSANQ